MHVQHSCAMLVMRGTNLKIFRHLSHRYMQTVDATLAADAYFVAIQRYESPNHIPDRLLLKMATACVACRNIDTAREFVELLVFLALYDVL